MTPAPLPVGATIGLLGGGQLGRMLAAAAARLGFAVHIYTPQADAVAGAVAAQITHGAWDDAPLLAGFARDCAVISYEFENVPLATARMLADHVPVRPGPAALAATQDRLAEKRFAAGLGIPTAPFAAVDNPAMLAVAADQLGLPLLLKSRRMGYDGKGQARLAAPDQAHAAWDAVGGQAAIAEGLVDFAAEFSVILVRGLDGAVRYWDSPHNVHADGILARSSLPAPPVIAGQVAAARAMAAAAAAALDYVGVMAAEFFATGVGPVLNEIAPRVHNSGHWTIEGAVTCQFENHIRAIAGWPLGDTATRALPVVMDNLIGPDIARLPLLLADPAARVHHYGKRGQAAGRKLGHVTWCGQAAT